MSISSTATTATYSGMAISWAITSPKDDPPSRDRQLEWIKNAVKLSWHRIECPDSDFVANDYSFKNERKLDRLGWHGLCVCDFSNREWKAISAFAKKRRERVWKSNRRYGDETLWFIGVTEDNPSVGVWFREETDLADFERMLETFKRPINFIVENDISARCWRFLRSLNHRVIVGENGTVLSIEDDAAGHGLMIRLSL